MCVSNIETVEYYFMALHLWRLSPLLQPNLRFTFCILAQYLVVNVYHDRQTLVPLPVDQGHRLKFLVQNTYNPMCALSFS